MCSAENSDKNIIVDSDKQRSSSTEEIFAVLQCASPSLIPDCCLFADYIQLSHARVLFAV